MHTLTLYSLAIALSAADPIPADHVKAGADSLRYRIDISKDELRGPDVQHPPHKLKQEIAPLLEQLTTTVAMGLSQVVVQHGWQRIGVCSAEGCDDVYVDTSRNASRRYCSNTCASRSTVAAYRARRKA